MAESFGRSPRSNIPSKRAKVTQDRVAPDAGAAPQEPTPPVFSRKLRKAAVGTGCDIRLRVTVAGFPKPSLTWYHNEELLPPSEAQDSGGLWIRDCRTNDAGLYTCVAANELGEARCSAVLAVMDLGEGNGTTQTQRSNVGFSQICTLKVAHERFVKEAAGTRYPPSGQTTEGPTLCQGQRWEIKISLRFVNRDVQLVFLGVTEASAAVVCSSRCN